MNALGQLAQELGVVTFEAFVAAARSRGVNPNGWLKAKQAGHLNTFKDSAGVLHVAPPGQTPEQYRDVYPERTVS